MNPPRREAAALEAIAPRAPGTDEPGAGPVDPEAIDARTGERASTRPSGVIVRPYDPDTDLDWAETVLGLEFAGRLQARRGELVDPLEGGGLVAEKAGEPAGLITWKLDETAAEAEIRVFVVVDRLRGGGIGGSLLDGALATLRRAGARSAWLVTTNDATDALAFYQRRGWRLVELRPGAVDDARRTLKPAIGRTGQRGIPIRDELELRIDP